MMGYIYQVDARSKRKAAAYIGLTAKFLSDSRGLGEELGKGSVWCENHHLADI